MTGLKGKIKKIHFKQLKKFQSTYNVNVTACPIPIFIWELKILNFDFYFIVSATRHINNEIPDENNQFSEWETKGYPLSAKIEVLASVLLRI